MGRYSISDLLFKGSTGQLINVSTVTKGHIPEKYLAALGMTATQFEVLIFVSLNRAGNSVELCHKLSVDSGLMTRMLACLEKKGLLLCGHYSGDRRCLRLDLSEAGRKVQEQPPLTASAATNELIACLSAEELQTLTHLLTEVLLYANCPRASLQGS